MSMELKPCPFCGGRVKAVRAPYGAHIFRCCGCDVEFCFYGTDGTESTLDKAVEAWNTRPREDELGKQLADFLTSGVPATEENMRKYGWVKERTCRNLDKHHNIMFKCSECGHWECQDFDGEKILPQTWNYCPNCGAKVVE